MTKQFFITGTDTEIGKTYVAEKLLLAYNKQNQQTLGLKPISCGTNEDAQILLNASSITTTINAINPYNLPDPISPHLAAQNQNITITIQNILTKLQPALNTNPAITITEGAGGIMVPINNTHNMYHLAEALNHPIIMVVAIKLGCINHALLSAEYIKQQQSLPCIGWYANIIHNNLPSNTDAINTIKTYYQNHLNAPLIDIITHNQQHIQTPTP